ncbi:helix-turn-helix domain-containing protein [Gulosibacter chungangensis]|uniref:Helix-turn-helix domain-containing protein n=1 Tax=Gulosibacter chungangensis TaxID=979746 RepID=A0A7J5B7S2_9MICO|nr:helix-turn-helix domain-containing protein [Gulosibacter chungangensis]KAB1640988.1 helix-turn-helix domain-containing protein [Gulosibacter chungangensis]
MNVEEAAAELNVSSRRVRALIAEGRIPAHREGNAWIIESLTAPKTRRSLSPRSWQQLARALKLRALEGLVGQERSRTAARIKALREAKHPSQLLLDWRPKDAPRDLYMDSLVAYAELGHDDYLKLSVKRPPEYLRDSQDLAQVVAAERAIQGATRKSLAEAADVPISLVRDIETGKPLTSLGGLRRVLKALEIEPRALPKMVLK